jgi:predicted ArsR family transcriptional regulator
VSSRATIERDDLMAYISAHPGQRGAEIAEALGTDTISMRPTMKRLIEEGKIKAQGRARAMTYSPA